MRYIIYGGTAGIAVCVLPVFWAQACVRITVWAFREGLVREEFAPSFGSMLMALPWLTLAGALGTYVIHLAMREYRDGRS